MVVTIMTIKWLKRFTELSKGFNKKVMVESKTQRRIELVD